MANLNHAELVQELRKIRIAQGLTAVKLSLQALPRDNSITNMENGQKKLYVDDYVQVCNALRINPWSLLRRLLKPDYVKSPSANQKTSVRGRPRKVSTVYAQDIQPQDVGDKP